jgi:predicted alpha/beta-hydrolase family hydrolase
MPDSASIVAIKQDTIQGFLHQPTGAAHAGLVLAHGAGANSQSALLVATAQAFCVAGFSVLRIDLPFRQRRPHGPPFPATAAQDRAGLQEALEFLKPTVSGPLYLGGHSYGGRQATMLAAERPDLAAGLLALSYPLHPPAKPAQLRTGHLPSLRTPALFVQGTKDGFGSIDEMRSALALIPARTELLIIAGAGHDLARGKLNWSEVVKTFVELVRH